MNVTNYIVSSTGRSYKERYVLPKFRSRMNELVEKMDVHECEPLLVIGKDGMWWNDDLCFILDRMSDTCCVKGTVLYEWANEIYDNPLSVGEKRTIEFDGDTYCVEADCSDLSNDGVCTNDCEPIEL